jgi:hypothetical protein
MQYKNALWYYIPKKKQKIQWYTNDTQMQYDIV